MLACATEGDRATEIHETGKGQGRAKEAGSEEEEEDDGDDVDSEEEARRVEREADTLMQQ